MNATLNQTGIMTGNLANYTFSFIDYLKSGNVIAIIIALVLFFVTILIINAVSKLLISLLKRTLLLIIILLIIYDFFPKYLELINARGWGFSTMFIGIGAVIASGTAFYIASRSFITSAKKHILEISYRLKNREDYQLLQQQREIELKKQELKLEQENLKSMFSKESLENEKSLLAVLVYLIVAEFGVFSSPTLSAPNAQVGIMFFVIFMLGIIVFTKISYKDPKKAMTYFGVTFTVGLMLSFLLGLLWQKNTLGQLLSIEFFTSDSLIAMITGMGVSLFAGSKG